MLEIVYYVHGATADNAEHRSTGWKDLPLTERGIKEANSLKEKICDKNFDLIVCSDLLRAKQTAEIVFENKDKIIYDPRLRECNYGKHNGDFSSNVVYDEHIKNPFENGESLKDVEKRIKSLCADLLKKYNGKKIAFMAHRAPQLALEVITKGITWQQAIENDWRKTKSWQPGWEYIIK